MPFFYHTSISGQRRSENIFYAAMYAIPNPKTSIMSSIINFLNSKDGVERTSNQAIGDIAISRRRAVPSAFLSGSLTVEAALALPVFLGALLLLLGLFQALAVYEQVNHHLCSTGRQLAAYSEAYDGSDTAALYRVFYTGISGSGIEADWILGGYPGIILSLSEDEDSELMELKAVYSIKIMGYLTAGRYLTVTDRIYVRPWTGGQLSGTVSSEDDKDRMVYVAENGVVYHGSDNCTYLQLSVQQTTLSRVEQLRNKYGARYYACEVCGHGSADSIIYVTDTGRAWHTNRQCSGLKRQLSVISEQAAIEHGLRACSRCGG